MLRDQVFLQLFDESCSWKLNQIYFEELHDTPAQVSGESTLWGADLDNFRWQTHCQDLVQLPIAA